MDKRGLPSASALLVTSLNGIKKRYSVQVKTHFFVFSQVCGRSGMRAFCLQTLEVLHYSLSTHETTIILCCIVNRQYKV